MPFTVLDRFLRPLRRGPQTRGYPARALELTAAARGLPELDATRCDANAACVAACPTDAIVVAEGTWRLDAGRCVFCAACVDACPTGALEMGRRVELADRTREALVTSHPIRSAE
jgi:formate hydrogenlyase subunit 6/NADH:ubiquinone oxidoreductase subunit I